MDDASLVNGCEAVAWTQASARIIHMLMSPHVFMYRKLLARASCHLREYPYEDPHVYRLANDKLQRRVTGEGLWNRTKTTLSPVRCKRLLGKSVIWLSLKNKSVPNAIKLSLRH